jgi:hypothetical protein
MSNHKSEPKTVCEHTFTFTQAEVAEILSAHACRQYAVTGTTASVRIRLPNEERDETDIQVFVQIY